MGGGKITKYWIQLGRFCHGHCSAVGFFLCFLVCSFSPVFLTVRPHQTRQNYIQSQCNDVFDASVAPGDKTDAMRQTRQSGHVGIRNKTINYNRNTVNTVIRWKHTFELQVTKSGSAGEPEAVINNIPQYSKKFSLPYNVFILLLLSLYPFWHFPSPTI